MSKFIWPPTVPQNYVICFRDKSAPQDFEETEKFMKNEEIKLATLKSFYGAMNFTIAPQKLESIEKDLLVQIIENITPLYPEGAGMMLKPPCRAIKNITFDQS